MSDEYATTSGSAGSEPGYAAGPDDDAPLRAIAHLMASPQQALYVTRVGRNTLLTEYGLTANQVARVNHFVEHLEPKVPWPNGLPGGSPRERPCPIGWTPTIAHPVFWGRERIAIGDQGTPLTIYYPTIHGTPEDAPLLRGCAGYSLILFLHGHCEQENAHLYRWERHLAQLARCGFVVAAPHQAEIGAGPTKDFLLERAHEVLTWMRGSWHGKAELLPEAATGVMGHSYGAMLAGRVAVTADIAAYASLGAVWPDWATFGDNVPEPLVSLTIPSLHVAGTQGTPLGPEVLDGARWASLPVPKHSAVMKGGHHFEYLQGQVGGCAPPASDCRYLGAAAGDLAAGFFARYLPPASLFNAVPPTLVAPKIFLTPEQGYFAGGHLMGLQMLGMTEGCEVAVTWEIDSGKGSITLGGG